MYHAYIGKFMCSKQVLTYLLCVSSSRQAVEAGKATETVQQSEEFTMKAAEPISSLTIIIFCGHHELLG